MNKSDIQVKPKTQIFNPDLISTEENNGLNIGKGAIVMLAWPETRVSRTGAWYDPISKAIGLIKDNTYKVGHAAFCLIDYENQNALYFDFGRYQSPLGYGRVRSEHTDPELKISINPIIKNGSVINLDKILTEIKGNSSSHGEGYIIGALRQNVKIGPVYDYISSLQNKDHIKYAPFKYACTNCSRFASLAFLKSIQENRITKLKNLITLFQFNLPVKQITQKSRKDYVHIIDENNIYHKLTVSQFKNIKSTLKMKPSRALRKSKNVVEHDYHELSGIGAKAYFKIKKVELNIFSVARFDEYNVKHFEHDYILKSGDFDINKLFEISYPSHARVISILQEGIQLRLEKL